MESAAVVQGVTVTFGGRPALDECHIALCSGLIHGIVGRGGAGKTVLLRTVATLARPDSGTLILAGEPVDHDDPACLRRVRSRVAMQFQNMALFDFLDVRANVAFGIARTLPAGEAETRVREALAAVGLEGAGALAVGELSGGMQRRVAIARAAVTGADLLLFDDPTGGLDPVTSSRIFRLIAGLGRERRRTVVVASHDLDRLAPVCDRLHVVEAGRVVFSGSLDQGRGSGDPLVRALLANHEDRA